MLLTFGVFRMQLTIDDSDEPEAQSLFNSQEIRWHATTGRLELQEEKGTLDQSHDLPCQ